MLNVKNKKVYLPLIVALSLAIACGAIACGIIFWPKKPLQKTTQEWLNDFKRSFSVIELANIDAEQPARLNVARDRDKGRRTSGSRICANAANFE